MKNLAILLTMCVLSFSLTGCNREIISYGERVPPDVRYSE
jgi:hypothetical protein